jgi:hypothetical protein
MAQLHVVVLEESRESQRNRQQAGALRLRLEAVRIGTADDPRELTEGGIVQAILVHECVEAALRPDVGQFHSLNIEWNSASLLCYACDVGRRHEQELGLPVDETFDKPRTRDPVDLGSLSCNPLHWDLR